MHVRYIRVLCVCIFILFQLLLLCFAQENVRSLVHFRRQKLFHSALILEFKKNKLNTVFYVSDLRVHPSEPSNVSKAEISVFYKVITRRLTMLKNQRICSKGNNRYRSKIVSGVQRDLLFFQTAKILNGSTMQR